MITIFIVEDERNASEALQQILKLIKPSNTVVGVARNVDDSVRLIRELSPDMVLLDVKIEGGTGFDVVNQLPDYMGKFVFTTAYSEYAVRAFKHNALDYLLKPIHSKELSSSLKRVLNQINLEDNYQKIVVGENDEELINQKKLVLKTRGVERVVWVDDIVRIQADSAYCTFYLKDSKVTVSKNLKYYASFLDNEQFLRCHQSHLVNINYIVEVRKGDILVLTNGDEVPISFRKKAFVLKKVRNSK